MVIDLTYKRNVKFMGRNGMFYMSGISVSSTPEDKIVTLQPFTSKGMIGNGFLEIPLEDVSSVIAALQKITAPK